MTDSNLPGTTKEAMPFDSLLAQGRDLVCERLAEALDGMLDTVDETLSALMSATQDPEERKVFTETRIKALAQRKTIAEQFRALYLREFQARSNRVKKTGQSFSELDSYTLELDLVGEDDLNETLKLNDMATKLRQYCDEELVALDQRVGVLLGDANLEAEDNPFSPQAICDAFKITCRQVDSNVKVRMVLLRLFDDHVLDDIRSVYKAVNTLLVQNSILPKIRYRVARGQEGSKAPPDSARAGEEMHRAVAHAVERAPGGEQDFFSVLQNLLAGSVKAMTQPGATAGTGASAQGVAAIPGFPPIAGTPGSGRMDGAPMVVFQGAELMSLLTRVQQGDAKAVPEGGAPLVTSAAEPGTTNVLRELKATSLGTGMNQLDSMTLDIVAMLFDQLFDDPKIPISVKGLIGRMQIPMLKVAIADKAFFSRKTHPARQLLDTLGEISARLPGDFNASNPLFGRLEGIIQELMDNFQDDVEIFDVVRERLQNLLQEEDRRVEEETRLAANRIEQNESLAASKTMAEYEVKTRVQAGNLPRPVREFLMHQWVKPLLIVHVRRGQHSDAWKNSLATMDLLIWSVEAKHSPAERQDLTTVVPELFKRLAAGLKIADIEDTIRERFFSDLKELHAEAMSVDGESEVAEAQGASAENLAAESDAAPAMKFDVASAAQPDAAPATDPDAVPAMNFDVAPPIKPEVVPAAKPDTVPAAKPDTVPAAKPAAATVAIPNAAPVTDPGAVPVMQFDAAPDIKPEAAPAAKPDAAPATKSAAVPAAKPDPAPATYADTVRVMKFDAATPIKPEAVLPAKPAAAPVTKPDAVPATKPAAAPIATPAVAPAAAAQTPKPVAASAAIPAAAQVTKPAAAPATRPAAVPTATPAVAPTAAAQTPKPVAAPAAKPAAPPSAKPAAPATTAQTPKPVAAPAAKPAAAPTATPAVAPATTAQTPRPVAAPATTAQAPRAVAAPAAKPAAAPVMKPDAVAATRPAGTQAGKPMPEPRKVTQPIPAAAIKALVPVQAQGADNDSLDFTKTLTIKNPFGAGKVHVKELETADVSAAGTPRAKGEVNEVEFIKNLKEGTWVEFREKDTKDTQRPAKLSFISPLRSSFLFVDKLGKTVKECSRTELGHLVRLGTVVVVAGVKDEAPLFDRMMAGIIGKLT